MDYFQMKTVLFILSLCFISVIFTDEISGQPTLQKEKPFKDIEVVEGFGGTVTVPEEDNVLILNNDNFHYVIQTKALILVEFYAPWCGHCKALEGEYATAASVLKGDGIRIAKIDATKEELLSKEFDITGYPTIKLFKKGEYQEEYDGPRKATGIVEYMKKHADPDYRPPPSVVKVLAAANFSGFVDSEALSLIEFYAPWCAHCKSLAPEYEGAAQDLQRDKILLAKVDATEEKDLAREFNVSGFPKLFVFRKGRHYEYRGPRSREGIVQYMRGQAKPPSSLLSSPFEAKTRMSRTEPVIFAYFEDETELFSEYIYAANNLREDYSIMHTFDEETARKYGLQVNSINIIFPDIYSFEYEKKIKTFDESSAASGNIVSWISGNIVPLVGQRTVSNMATRYAKRPLVVVYFDVNFSHQFVTATQIVRRKILPVAAAHTSIMFAISSEDEFTEEMKNVGLADSGEDVNVAIFGDKGFKCAMESDENFSSEKLHDFVSKFKNGQLKPYLKSQPVPKRQDGPVYIVVANNFESEILKSDKDVLIEFFAPWCGHCKKLEPIYKKLAKYYAKENPNLKVTKMDATANDVDPIFSVQGFPTIYLLKSTDKENPILFQDHERTFEGFKKFLMNYLGEGPLSESTKDEL